MQKKRNGDIVEKLEATRARLIDKGSAKARSPKDGQAPGAVSKGITAPQKQVLIQYG